MNQDINGIGKTLGGTAPGQGVSMLGLKSAESSVPAAHLITDPLFRAITADMSLAPSELKDWMRTDLDSDGAKIISPDVIRAKRAIQAALSEAESEVLKFAVNREWKNAKQIIQNSRIQGIANAEVEEAKVKLAALDSGIRNVGIPKYARTTKALRNYADAVLTYISKLSDSERDRTAIEAVLDLETRLMPKVDNIYMGIPGKLEALNRVPLTPPFDAITRLKELEKHLGARSLHIDMDQEARVSSVANNPIFKDILSRNDLPTDGAVFFIEAEKMVRVPNGTTPLMIDVTRMSLGLGKEGAGLFRYIGHEADIDGAAIIRLKLKNGKPIPLKGSDPANPKYAKEVAELVGNVPEWLKVGMTFGEVMKRFGDSSLNKPAAPKE